ncbi:MAG: hypothetical protein QNJ47_23935 [Nostocaceae cyanobacterium]|nr:hypothetical protein [Nostocaceae cyanobacterium]
MVDFDLRNWDLAVRRIYRAKKISSGRWEPIPPQTVSISKPLCVIKIQNKYAPATWRYVSTATIFIQGIRVFSERIYLNEPVRINIDESSSSYQLKFWFPWWHREINLQIWQNNNSDNCETCKTLDRIENKIDNIFDYSI